MSNDVFPISASDVQTIENVLADTNVDGLTRAGLLKRAAVGAAAVAAISPTGRALAAMGSTDTVDSVVTTAITAEALAVTYLSGVIGAVKGDPVDKFRPVLKNALSAEYDHYKALKGLGGKPLTLKFWAPDAALKPENVFPTLEAAEELFVNAYLVGITVFTNAGKPDLARYAAEILGTEAEHRALARFAQGKLPNNKGFESYALKTTKQHVAALEKLGIGFGKQGAMPGKFYTFKTPTSALLGSVKNDAPA